MAGDVNDPHDEQEEVPPGGQRLPADPPWDAWHPAEITERLRGVDVPWCVAAGWALDLFRGGSAREHEDLEIAVPIGRFGEIRTAIGDAFAFDVVGSGRRWPLDHAAFEVMHQTWVRDAGTGVYRLDIFREPHDGEIWINRREPTMRFPYAEIIEVSPDGIPYLAPELVLWFKAKHQRPKDQDDFEGTLPLLDPSRRTWLAGALAKEHPGHRWLGRL